MKPIISIAFALFFSLMFSQCSLVDSVVPKTAKASGKWDEVSGKGGGDNLSPRNHYYTFDVNSNNKTITISLSSDIDAGFSLYDPLGQLSTYTYGGREHEKEVVLNKGKYTILIYCVQRDGIGSYKLNVSGTSSGLERTNFQRLKVENAKFSPDGGGGNFVTFRNHIYQFETTEDNSVVDVSLDMAVNDGFFILYNQLGEVVVYTYSGRSKWEVRELPKGTNTLLVGTYERDALNSVYELNIFGKVQNLRQVPFQSETVKSSWSGLNSVDTYSLRVTEDNSTLDVALKSPDIDGYFTVSDPLGNIMEYTYSGRNKFTVSKVNKGTYTIKTYPYQGKGSYSLIIYGQFTDLKKQ